MAVLLHTLLREFFVSTHRSIENIKEGNAPPQHISGKKGKSIDNRLPRPRAITRLMQGRTMVFATKLNRLNS